MNALMMLTSVVQFGNGALDLLGNGLQEFPAFFCDGILAVQRLMDATVDLG